MKPNREAADRIISLLTDAQSDSIAYGVEFAHNELIMRLSDLASNLIPVEESYGHAERIHKLTGG